LIFAWLLLANRLAINNPIQQIKLLWTEIIDRLKVLSMFKLNADIMIRTFVLLAGFAWFADKGAQIDDTVLAANHVLLQFISLSAFFLDGFAYVVEMLSGRAIGQKDRKSTRLNSSHVKISYAVFCLKIKN